VSFVLAARADAHISDPSILTVVDAGSPDLPGVTAQVAESVTPELVIGNRSQTDLIVLGDKSEPFLRIGPAGAFANLASPTWYLTNSPAAVATVPPDAVPGAAPRWVQISAEPSWGWFEHRMHVDASVLLRPLPTHPKTLKHWTVPVLYGDRPATVSGRVLRRPVVGGYTARVRRLTPAVAGLTVQVAPGAVPALFASYSGTAPVVVIGAADEQFLRFGHTGVEANLHSPTWIDNLRARDQDVSGLSADPAAVPEWSVVSALPTLSWLDPRGEIPDRAVTDTSLQRHRWRVPIDTASGRSVLQVVSTVTGTGS
jgi:hypothetical protein